MAAASMASFPGYGRVQRDRILRTLGRATAGHHFVFETLRNLPTRFFPAQSQVIFVSPVNSDDVPTLIQLRAHDYAVMIVSPEPDCLRSACAHAR